MTSLHLENSFIVEHGNPQKYTSVIGNEHRVTAKKEKKSYMCTCASNMTVQLVYLDLM